MEIREENYKYSPTNLDLVGFILLIGKIKEIVTNSELKLTNVFEDQKIKKNHNHASSELAKWPDPALDS